MKQCTRCDTVQDIECFGPSKKTKDGKRSCCKTCEVANTKRWLAKNPGYLAERNQKLRIELIAAYGGKCACCGESQYEFMSLDHIANGRGNPADRSEPSYVLWGRLRREGWPQGEFQILCHNCNLAKGFYGACPHGSLAVSAVVIAVAESGEKRCTGCGVMKSLDLFGKHKAMRDGRQSWCNACSNANTKRWHAKNPGYAAEWRARHPNYFSERKVVPTEYRSDYPALRKEMNPDIYAEYQAAWKAMRTDYHSEKG